MTKTIFDMAEKGKNTVSFVPEDAVASVMLDIPPSLLRDAKADGTGIPDVPEVELVRHYINLSTKNFGIDNGTYPLGSCTMKYNPKINEAIANLDGFKNLHPLQFLQDLKNSQGIFQVLFELERMLSEITGMDTFSLQPAAGAHGEFTGMLVIKKHLMKKGEDKKRNKIIVPDTAHGTNPASAAVCNFDTIEIKSNADGLVDLDQLKEALKPGDVAGIMLTNPNTLGLFEKDILAVTALVHESGGLCYYDGANLNGLCGICRPGDMGFDIIHVNLHKTFATPHGGGGPGAGPVGVKGYLKEFLPGPRVVKHGDVLDMISTVQDGIDSVKAFHGNIAVIIKAYCYIKALGLAGLRKATMNAVLNANYCMARLVNEKILNVPYKGRCYHEFVANDEGFPNGVSTEDIAKRMLDFGVHAPTVFFPLVVHGALMIEPSETECIHRLDDLVSIFKNIKQEAERTPEVVKGAPHTMPVGRLDSVQAAREPVLTHKMLVERKRK